MSKTDESPGSSAADPVVPEGTDEFQSSLDAVERLVRDNDRFLVVAHESPDGDAVGSTLATGLLLRELGKDVVVYNRDSIPYNFEFLPGTELWQTDLEGADPFDATIVLDCGTPGRVGEDFPDVGWGQKVAVVDHHDTWNPEFADVYLRDPEASATGEILYRLVTRFGPPSEEVAENLYCCVLTDTGSFRYSNTSRTAFRVAGELVDRGVDPWEMTCEVYENQPRERFDLLCMVLETLEVTADGRLAFLTVEREMLDELGVGEEMTDGLINYARSIRGVEVATLLRDRGDEWRISFRSRGNVDVSRIAEAFGGGGHYNAAGCVVDDDVESIRRRLTETLVDLLDESDNGE